VLAHGNNSLHVDISPHSETLAPIPKLPIFAFSSVFIVNQVVIRLETLDHHSSLGPTGHVKKSYHFASIYDQKSKKGTTQNVV